MNIKLNHKIIQDMCGTVSFKRGASFFRSNKVIFNHFSPQRCSATVIGSEEFKITIEVGAGGEIHTNCSCPNLISYDQDCQHIAAVLLAIYEHQCQGTCPPVEAASDEELTAGILALFHDQPAVSSSRQLHFEKREMLPVTFICKPVTTGTGEFVVGMELKICSINIDNIRLFLESMKVGQPYKLSPSFTYDQRMHCFQQENDAIIQELIQIIDIEKVYAEKLSEEALIPIPQTSWRRMLPLLAHVPMVRLENEHNSHNRLIVSDGQLPLKFEFAETDGKGCQLKIEGLEKITIFESYHFVLYDGIFKQLEHQECKRLAELKQMLAMSGTAQIPIPMRQVGYFLEKIAPGLKKVGSVTISQGITNRFMNTALNAKLYLDRVKNRILAGLEFHYENIIINPLENREPVSGAMFIRDIEKEDEILKLMDEGCFAKTEGGYFLHNEELEYEFLYHIVPKLQKLTQIYATTAVRNRIFRVNNRPLIRVKLKKERINWLEFTFEMDSIPEKQIKDVLAALEEKRKYYRLHNGALLSLETSEMEEIRRFLQMPYVAGKDLSNGLDVPVEQCLQLLDEAEEVDMFVLEKSFRGFLSQLYHPNSLAFEVPESLEPILRDYQKSGYQWMKTMAYYGFGGILADEMGLGKTLQSITFICSELSAIRKQKLPALIVCPSALMYNWLNEIRKFAKELQPIVIDGSKKEREQIQRELEGIDVIITSYPLLRRDIKWYEKQSFHTVFFDEAQAFKNPLTQTARAVKKINASHRFALTGTPLENSIEELWSIFHVVFPELFRGLRDYSKLTKKKISRRIKPFILRRLKADVLIELPDKMESLELSELQPEQKKLYAAYLAKLRHDTLKHLDKETLRKNHIRILAGLTRLRQICCHPGLFVDGYNGTSGKYEQLMSIINEAKQSGRRVLIFSQFTKMLKLIGRDMTLQGLHFFYLDGQTQSEERVEICNRFNEGERDFFLISLKAGGTGLNLMTADTVILYDTWWNPAVEQQAMDRAHRMGQKNTVQVLKLIARGTIEEKMNELQEKKRDLIEQIIDSDEKMLSSLTEEEIREILMI